MTVVSKSSALIAAITAMAICSSAQYVTNYHMSHCYSSCQDSHNYSDKCFSCVCTILWNHCPKGNEDFWYADCANLRTLHNNCLSCPNNINRMFLKKSSPKNAKPDAEAISLKGTSKKMRASTRNQAKRQKLESTLTEKRRIGNKMTGSKSSKDLNKTTARVIDDCVNEIAWCAMMHNICTQSHNWFACSACFVVCNAAGQAGVGNASECSNYLWTNGSL